MPETRLLVDPALRSELERAGLLDINSLFAREDLEVVKARLESRQTYRISAAGRTYYVKLYRTVAPATRLISLFAQRFDSPASREWHVLKKLQELQVPAIQPAACIEELTGSAVTRAAFVSIGLDSRLNLEELMQQFRNEPQPLRRQTIALRLADTMRRMHEGGVNHRDFYAVHIRVDEHDQLFVTDLNRADIRKRVTRRWRVKDLAALLHSLPHSIVTATDRARFAKTYFGAHLREHRSMIRAVIRKAQRMTAHTRKRVAEGEANYHVVE